MAKAVITFGKSGFNLLKGKLPQYPAGLTVEQLTANITPKVAKNLRQNNPSLTEDQALKQARAQIRYYAKKAQEAFSQADEIDFQEEK